jgi:DNA-binding MarR family transcriptional regulator
MNDTRPGALLSELLGALHAVQARLESTLEPLGLSLAKFGALNELVEAAEPLALGALADRCACVRSNITQLIDRLEAEQLVVRADDPRDRRSVRAELTEEGRSRHAAGLRMLAQAEQEVLSHIPDQHREAFRQTLESLKALRGVARV